MRTTSTVPNPCAAFSYLHCLRPDRHSRLAELLPNCSLKIAAQTVPLFPCHYFHHVIISTIWSDFICFFFIVFVYYRLGEPGVVVPEKSQSSQGLGELGQSTSVTIYLTRCFSGLCCVCKNVQEKKKNAAPCRHIYKDEQDVQDGITTCRLHYLRICVSDITASHWAWRTDIHSPLHHPRTRPRSGEPGARKQDASGHDKRAGRQQVAMRVTVTGCPACQVQS